MKMQRAWFFIILIAALIVATAMLSTREPRYNGRTLTSWLQQCFITTQEDPQQRAEAQAAVRAMPIRKVLPYLLKLVETTDDPVSLWIIDVSDRMRISDKYGTRLIKWHSSEDFQEVGIASFEILGTNAAPAVGELSKLLDQPNLAFSAYRCLDFIGKPAESALCRCLTNQDAQVREGSILALASVTDDVEIYINRIKGCVGDPSDLVRGAAVHGISAQTQAPDVAVPPLVVALEDSSDMVSASAANALAHFGTNALSAFPTLTNLVEHGGLNTANAALKTLVAIAPNESFSILTNCVARGRPSTGGALQILVASAPAKVFPIILAGTKSTFLNQRRVSFRLLADYPLTPEVRSAMQDLAADPDMIISGNAKRYLTDLYQKEHPEEFLFQDDPTYGGKGLGEWLEAHDNDGNYTKDAKDAFRHMGTNAIPALLKRLVFVQPPFGTRDFTININALKGFIALGDAAIPALPQLQEIMGTTNKDFALYAMMSTCGTGSNAIPFLVRGLTNQFADVRSEAANSLMSDLGAQFPDQRKVAVPFLTKLLSDPDANIRASAVNALKGIDPVAAAKAGIK